MLFLGRNLTPEYLAAPTYDNFRNTRGFVVEIKFKQIGKGFQPLYKSYLDYIQIFLEYNWFNLQFFCTIFNFFITST